MKSIVVPFPKKSKLEPRRLALTEQRVADLQPDKRTRYVLDARNSHLAVRVTAKGSKSYIFSRKIKGEHIRITLGKTGALSLKAAREACSSLSGDIAKGLDVVAARKALVTKSINLQQAYDRFLGLKDRRKSTRDDYETVWRLHVPDSLKRKAVADIAAPDIERITDVLGKQSKKRTANKVAVLISAIMSKSGRWANNPAREVARYQEAVRTRRLSPDELKRLVATLDIEAGDLWADFFTIMIQTGARRGALSAMRWSDIDLINGVWVVPAIWSKNRREIALALPKRAIGVLKRRRGQASSNWVWPSQTADSGHVTEPRKPWLRFLNKAAISKHATMHDVRRTMGSNLAASGASGAVISAALGHLSPQSAKAYTHLDVEPARQAMEKALKRGVNNVA